MAIAIKKLKIEEGKPITRRIMVYSDPGAGKTHLIGTAQDVPEMADVLVVDIDGGSTTLKSRGDIAGTEARSTKTVEEVIGLFAHRDPSIAHIKTLVLDGGSELQKRDLADIALREATVNSKRDQDSNQIQDYKLSKSRLLRLFRAARDIPDINIIITCWALKDFPKKPGTNQADTDAQPTQIQPDLGRAVRDTLMGYLDDVWYLYFDPASGNRYLVTADYGSITAKTRDAAVAAKLTSTINGKVVPILTNPTFTDIYECYKTAYMAGSKK